MRLLGLLAARLRREDGVAIYAAMGALAVTSVLAGTVATGAVQLSDETIEGSNSKRAFAAAEAGVRTAVYRINKLAPSNGLCLTDVPTAPVNGACPPYDETMSNGASYRYYVTPILSLADRCAGLAVQAEENGEVIVVHRCVTATGTVHGVKRRIQVRVAAFQGLPIFPLGGILGLNGVELSNSSVITGAVGSNGQIRLGNSNTVTDGFEISASAPNPILGSSSNTGTTRRRSAAQGPWVLAPVDPGNSATVNDNGRLLNGQDAKSNTTYTAATRALVIGNSGSVTLGGGTYNFCSLTFTNSGNLSVAPGAKVRVFIDSPDRAGSGCPPASGGITADNSININVGRPPEDLQIYVWGRGATGTANGTLEFKNSTNISAAIHAPQSEVVFRNSAVIVGAIAASEIEFKNSVAFTWPTDAGTLADMRARALTIFFRSAWRECDPVPTDASQPQSGC